MTTTDANNTTITTNYDDLDRVVSTQQGGTVLTQTLYDSYGSDAKSFNSAHAYGVAKRDNMKGVVTSTKALVLGSSTYLTSSTYYDELGRVIQTVSDNAKGGLDRSSSKLDFAGRVLESKLTTTNSSTSITVDKRMAYEQGGRVKSVCQKVSDNQPSLVAGVADATRFYWEPVARHSYNGIGELTQKTLGCGIQSIDYQYQMRGWLSQLNDPANLNQGFAPTDKQRATPRFFGMKLGYDGVGNITTWDYRNAQTSYGPPYDLIQQAPYRYGFSYDNLNRVKMGNLTQSGNAVFSLDNLNYDPNGNITTLNRTMGSSLDRLSYSYEANSNRLSSVSDGSGSAAFAQSSSYEYDAAGNLIKDSGKGITTSISYTYLNLPKRVVHSGGTVNYTYSAAGQKLKADFGGGKSYDYVAGLVYDQAGLEFIPTAEGRVLPPGKASTTVTTGSSTSVIASNQLYRYEYHLKDHLGNLRVACRCGERQTETSPGDSYEPLVVQEQHYDPFGLSLSALSNVKAVLPANRFNFNGKEDEAALGWIDFKWRHYDASIARFVNVDRLAEKFTYMTPYQFASNDPVNKIELDGVPVNPSSELWKATGFGYQPGAEESYQLGKTLLQEAGKAYVAVVLLFAPVEEVLAVGLGLGAKAVGLELKEAVSTTKLLTTENKVANSSKTQAPKALIGPAGDPSAQVVKQIPTTWEAKTSKNGQGTLYKDPSNPTGNVVRVQSGNPNSPNPSQQRPYVKEVQNGRTIDNNGKQVNPKAPESHIPADEYKYKKRD